MSAAIGVYMVKKIVKRILGLIVILFVLSFLVFLIMYLAPGDPAEKRLTSQGVVVTKEVLEAERERLGLLQPFIVRYGDWLSNILKGDFGVSFKDDLPVAPKLVKGLKNTLQLALASLLLAIVISFPLGILSAVKKGKLVDHVVRLLSFIGNSLPNFLISVLLMYLLCIKFKLFPVIADGTIKGLMLPAISLAIPVAGRFTRQIRSELIEELDEEYVTGMKSRRVKGRYILVNNVMRNALGHILTIIGLQIGTLMGGSVVIENIFRWPGIGKLVMDSITARDYPVIMGFVLIMGTIYVVINLIVDICFEILDPRSV